MDYEKKYKQLYNFISDLYPFMSEYCKEKVEGFLPELKESEDELTWLTKYVEEEAYSLSMDIRDSEDRIKLKKLQKALSWLEKQGSEPNWCHHKVDLSNCSEEYRKAYYDGWNNCNQQHSQCKSESNDVVKCLINGMKFYYEDNEEATWGTEKFSMKVKDILSWLEKQDPKKHEEELEKAYKTADKVQYRRGYEAAVKETEKQGGQKSDWSNKEKLMLNDIIEATERSNIFMEDYKRELVDWLKSLKQRIGGEQ